MNKLILLFGVLICLVAVNARHHVDRTSEETEEQETLKREREHVSGHRRKRWQSSYGYDYPPPPSFYYPDRRDDRNNQETIQNIYRLLEDISSYLRRTPPPPPPPPQPIYIPYPVAFPTRVTCRPSQNASVTNVPNPDRRNTFTEAMDQNRNWGFVAPVEADYGDDDNDGARPISFEPLVPKQLMKRPAPQVEHGSQQAAFSTEAPKFAPSVPLAASFSASSSTSTVTVPGMCNAAILSCCGFSGDTAKQRQCFGNVGCAANFGGGSACTSDSIQKALDSFRTAYSPVQ